MGAQVAAVRHATADTTVDSGTRIGVSVASTFRQSPFGAPVDRLEGTVRTISHDTLYMNLPNVVGAVAIPRASIREVEISLGPSRREGALRGGAVGALFMGLSMWVQHQNPEKRVYREAWQAVAIGGAMGFGMGAWVGSRLPYERWRAIRLPD
jgi:hypothetical protein